MLLRPLVLLFAASTLVGCVSKSQYLEMEQRHDSCSSQLTEEQEKAERLQAHLDKMKERTKARVRAYEELMDEFRPLIERGVLELKVDKGSIAIGMAADVLFPSGSAELSEDGAETIREIARVLERRSDREFQVQGHTDDDPIATAEFPSNWHLGAARALNVVRFMVDSGLSATQLSAATYGEHAPLARNDSDAHKAANRRIEIVFLPDLSDLPGHEELLKAARDGGRPAARDGDRPGKRDPDRPPRGGGNKRKGGR